MNERCRLSSVRTGGAANQQQPNRDDNDDNNKGRVTAKGGRRSAQPRKKKNQDSSKRRSGTNEGKICSTSTRRGHVRRRESNGILTALCMILPALKKLDAMLIGILDGFQDTEFWFVDRGIIVAHGEDCDVFPSGISRRPSFWQEEKWWLPCPRVPPSGLSDEASKMLQQCRDCTNQILKAAMAINSSVLAEMEIPCAFIETLPKVYRARGKRKGGKNGNPHASFSNGRYASVVLIPHGGKSAKACLGDIFYRYVTADQMFAELTGPLNRASSFRKLRTASRLQFMFGDRKTLSGIQSQEIQVKGLVTDTERNQFLAQRAETPLQSLRHRFPGPPLCALDMSKIQYNKMHKLCPSSISHKLFQLYIHYLCKITAI
ncbi:PRONE domain [Dillenia turbinata]|uniref:PRONE domain n=1 Tax=Dillenia turbinata TaxID=194707 RepID=A0AAN8US29_9MAGN